MSDKQHLLKAIEALPDGATWGGITDRLLALVARDGAVADFARLCRAKFGPEQLAEYLDPKSEHALGAVIAELEAQSARGVG